MRPEPGQTPSGRSFPSSVAPRLMWSSAVRSISSVSSRSTELRESIYRKLFILLELLQPPFPKRAFKRRTPREAASLEEGFKEERPLNSQILLIVKQRPKPGSLWKSETTPTASQTVRQTQSALNCRWDRHVCPWTKESRLKRKCELDFEEGAAWEWHGATIRKW